MTLWLKYLSLSLSLSIVPTEACLAQPLELNCSTSTDNESTYFPDIPIDNISLADAIGDSPYLSQMYIYSFQPVINTSCSGKTNNYRILFRKCSTCPKQYHTNEHSPSENN
jgi:hypothetical protein